MLPPRNRYRPHAGKQAPVQLALQTSQASTRQLFVILRAPPPSWIAPPKFLTDSNEPQHPAEPIPPLSPIRRRLRRVAAPASAPCLYESAPAQDSVATAVLL